MKFDKKTQNLIWVLITCGILITVFYFFGFQHDQSTANASFQQNTSDNPSPWNIGNDSTLTVNPLPDQVSGNSTTLRGTTTLPQGSVLQIAISKEPFMFTKCEPGTFCGSKTFTTIVSKGLDKNTWSMDLNTTGFTNGGYDVWIIARDYPNTSVHTSLNMR